MNGHHPQIIQWLKELHMDSRSKMAGACRKSSIWPDPVTSHSSHSAFHSRKMTCMDKSIESLVYPGFSLNLANKKSSRRSECEGEA